MRTIVGVQVSPVDRPTAVIGRLLLGRFAQRERSGGVPRE
jgi:hypothetical protein